MNWTPTELAERLAANPSVKLKANPLSPKVRENRPPKRVTDKVESVAKKSKYRNVKTAVDGILFDSKKEADRYLELKSWRRAGKIRGLERQVKFKLILGDESIGSYVADFAYDERQEWNWRPIVEDVKSEVTRKLPVYRMKKKLMKAIHGIEIREV